jgi:methyl-accepting chemotaxis protein
VLPFWSMTARHKETAVSGMCQADRHRSSVAPAVSEGDVMRRSLRFKLVGVVAIVLAGTLFAALVSVVAAGAARNDVSSVGGTYLPATRVVGDLRVAVANYHDSQLAYLMAQDQKTRTAAAADLTKHRGQVGDAFAALTALALTPDGQAKAATARAGWVAYLADTANLTTTSGTAELIAMQSGSPAAKYAALDADLLGMSESLSAGADLVASDANSLMGFLPVLMAMGCALVLLVGGGLAWFLSGGIVRGIGVVVSTLTSVAEHGMTSLEAGLAAFAANDLTVQVDVTTKPIEHHGADEVGQMAVATNAMLERLRATMDSYEQARANLSGALGEVHVAAQSVSATSAEVNDAAQQSGQGSAQIAHTIGQVAFGASDQARAASDTANAVNDLQSVIESVRGGAAETARSVEAQAAAVDQMTRSIRSASRASADVQSLGAAAGEAATNGALTVRQTVDGMARIKDAVEGAAVKVTQLGAKGEQIGAIVETIDDIAEQTNLLALNAAIEAARAGEQGKGFAVVADEVRKLAERSSRATKEIADLIGEVQQGTDQAVKAMQIGAREVESGAELASKSGAALDDISSAVESSNAAVARIVKAMDDMQASSSGLVSASDAIAAIAQETNAAAESMTSSAEQVARSVESIAAISEENSASAEEVSAATEQMSAQAEEVVASASVMADMATRLEGLAGRFRIDDAGSDAGRGEPVDLSAAADQRPRRAA